MWRGMLTKNRVLAGMIAGLFVLGGCDDDDDDHRDAGRMDAMVVRDAGRDAAAPRDADMRDTGVDAAQDAAMDLVSTLMLTPENEVPPCDGASDTAEGSGTVTLNAAGTEIQVMDLMYANLSGGVTAGHIHFGGPDEAGPIVLDLGPDFTQPIDRTFTEADYPSPPPEDAPATWDEFVAAMRAGDTYVNLHTAVCPMGEIRDQIE